jgi:hypothetical protein
VVERSRGDHRFPKLNSSLIDGILDNLRPGGTLREKWR